MKHAASALLLALVTASAFVTPVHATTNVTVTLNVHASVTFPFNEPAFLTECEVSVPEFSDAGAVLDQAVAGNCIEDWDSISFVCCGRLVTNITKEGEADATNGRNTFEARFLCGANPFAVNPGGSITTSSWVFLLNGAGSPVGIDSYAAANADTLEFVYVVDDCTFATTLAVSIAGTHVDSPVPLRGTAATDPGSL